MEWVPKRFISLARNGAKRVRWADYMRWQKVKCFAPKSSSVPETQEPKESTRKGGDEFDTISSFSYTTEEEVPAGSAAADTKTESKEPKETQEPKESTRKGGDEFDTISFFSHITEEEVPAGSAAADTKTESKETQEPKESTRKGGDEFDTISFFSHITEEEVPSGSAAADTKTESKEPKETQEPKESTRKGGDEFDTISSFSNITEEEVPSGSAAADTKTESKEPKVMRAAMAAGRAMGPVTESWAIKKIERCWGKRLDAEKVLMEKLVHELTYTRTLAAEELQRYIRDAGLFQPKR